eukprot:3587811-Amphidinium_carterae.1
MRVIVVMRAWVCLRRTAKAFTCERRVHAAMACSLAHDTDSEDPRVTVQPAAEAKIIRVPSQFH